MSDRVNIDKKVVKLAYNNIIRIMKEHGEVFPKKHGNWVRLQLLGDKFLALDTWNGCVCLKAGSAEYNQWTGFDGEVISTLGIDFGGFEIKDRVLTLELSKVLDALCLAIAGVKNDG